MLRPVFAICLLPLLASSPAHNRVHAGTELIVSSGHSTQNAVCILCSVRVESPVDGSLIIFAGNAYIDGAVHGSVLDFGGRVILTGNASVGSRIVVFGGHLYQDPAAKIDRHAVVISPVVFLPILLVLGAFILSLIFLLRMFYPRGLGSYPPMPRF